MYVLMQGSKASEKIKKCKKNYDYISHENPVLLLAYTAMT